MHYRPTESSTYYMVEKEVVALSLFFRSPSHTDTPTHGQLFDLPTAQCASVRIRCSNSFQTSGTFRRGVEPPEK